MTDLRHDDPKDSTPALQLARNRRAARRTAWMFAGIALAIYVGFLVMGVLGK